jgi:hypothetical protein
MLKYFRFIRTYSLICNFFSMAQQPLVGQGLIIEASQSHSDTLGRTPLDEWSARRRDLYLTTHNTHKWQTSMLPAGFEPAIPEIERPQTHALDRAANCIYNTYICTYDFWFTQYCDREKTARQNQDSGKIRRGCGEGWVCRGGVKNTLFIRISRGLSSKERFHTS